MIFNVNFNLSAWVRDVEVEANSEEEAVAKLNSMSISELIEEGAVFDSEMSFSDIDIKVNRYNAIVEVSDIEYDLDPNEISIEVIEYLKAFLPTNKTITIKGVLPNDDLEELVRDEISYITNYDVKSFNYKVIDRK